MGDRPGFIEKGSWGATILPVMSPHLDVVQRSQRGGRMSKAVSKKGFGGIAAVAGLFATTMTAATALAQPINDPGLKGLTQPTIELGFHFVSIDRWDGDYIGSGNPFSDSADQNGIGFSAPWGGGVHVAAAFENEYDFENAADFPVNDPYAGHRASVSWDQASFSHAGGYTHNEVDLALVTNFVASLNISEHFRLETETAYIQHDVDLFRSFGTTNQDLRDSTRGLAFVGSDQRRHSVESIIIGGRGRVEAKATFANGIWNLPVARQFLSPYVGAGIGLAELNVDYRPGGVALVDEERALLAVQLMMGAVFQSSLGTELVFNARYRRMDGADIDTVHLLDGFQIEDETLIGEVGIRHPF